MDETGIKRLNWGCGRRGVPGWINADRGNGRELDIRCDIRDGLPLDSESIDYIGSVHALQEIPYSDLVPVLQELRRVLKTGGVLRLCLPDLDKGIEAYLRKDRDFFVVPDERVRSLGGKFITQLTWYGHTRTPFTFDFIEELLLEAGFRRVDRCGFRATKSPYPGIVELDNRELESLFVEALK
jgi:predicted SAM-dependent methyltransferase